MTRPLDKHIDSQELEILVSYFLGAGPGFQGPPTENALIASRHVRSCLPCTDKVSKYRGLMDRSPSLQTFTSVSAETDCRENDDVDWEEVAAGLWPPLRASQLIAHAAVCDDCGPRLRDAAFIYNDEPSPREAKFLAELRPPSRPKPTRVTPPYWPRQWPIMRWVSVSALVFTLFVTAFILLRPAPRASLSGLEFAELAVHTHKQYASGKLELDVRSDSQRLLNDWLKQTLPFPLALPENPPAPGEVRPYQIEGARLVRAGGKSAAFIAYQLKSGPSTLIVTPDSVAVASGGVAANFKKVSFHYATVEGYKVVTWTQHGRTYALVSREGNSTQQSCMICHSAMRDRDLTNTPTPLAKPILQ